MTSARPLSKRETAAAQLAAERTKDDVLRTLAIYAESYREGGMTSDARAIEGVARFITERLPTVGVVVEL